MSLICELYVNSRVNGVGEIMISRNSGNTAPDSRNTYFYTVSDRNGDVSGTVTHRYGDGAVKLLHLVLTDFYSTDKV